MAEDVEEVLVTASRLQPTSLLNQIKNVLALPVSGSITLRDTEGRDLATLAIETTLEETHTDVLHITEHPVESGASITDHAFKKPTEVVLRCGWSNASLNALRTTAQGVFAAAIPKSKFSAIGTRNDYVGGIYSQLLALQQLREPVSITTSLRIYDNMLITSLQVTRDQKTSQVLLVTATFREVIIVSTRSATLPPQSSQANPASTAEVENVGTKQLKPGSPAPGGSVPSSEW